MKRIVCEVCGGFEFAKENGQFICRGCGLQYSLEEVRNLMVDVADDGVAPVQPVVVDHRMENLYARARKSLEVDDLEHAAEYYKQILDEKPNDWEAYFYSYLGETVNFTNAQASGVASKLISTIPSAYDMAIADGDMEAKGMRAVTISRKIAERLSEIALGGASLLREYEGGFALSTFGQVNASMYRQLRPMAQGTILTCVLGFDDLDAKVEDIYRNKKAIDERAYIECVLTLRRTQVQLADMTFAPVGGIKEHLIKTEVLESYKQRLANTEYYAAAAMQRINAEQTRKQWEERQARREAYWAEHADEKAELIAKKQILEEERQALVQKANELRNEINAVAATNNQILPEEQQLQDQLKKIADLDAEMRSLGVFKAQEKKELQQRIDQEHVVAAEMQRQINAKKAERARQIQEETKKLSATLSEIQAQLWQKNNAVQAIDTELNADR